MDQAFYPRIWNGRETHHIKGYRKHSKRNPSFKAGEWNLKKGYGHIRQKVNDIELCHFIDEHKGEYPIQTMCDVLEMPRSTYYKSKQKSQSQNVREKTKN